jgi:hypothetical protein
MANTAAANKAPTKFIVQSHEDHKRSLPKTIIPIVVVLGYLWHFDPKIEKDPLWFLGGLAIGLILLETAPLRRDVELSLTICPVGVQRTSRINKNRPVNHPLLPRESIQDCILTEHVGAFSVSSHLVFRVENSSLASVFPNASLSFEQCHSLVKQIQRALDET